MTIEDDDSRLDVLAARIAESRHNLVARGDRGLVRTVHVPEALAIGALLRCAAGSRWLDLGTGGGLPGLVLAIQRPDVRWTLLDATSKKVEAVAAIARELRLTNVDAVSGRAETVARDPAHRERYDGVVSRAVARLPVLVEYCRGFVPAGGHVVAVKGSTWAAELKEAAAALALLRLTVIHTDELPAMARPTWLVTMRAAGPAPPTYPRRDGVPRTNPLGR